VREKSPLAGIGRQTKGIQLIVEFPALFHRKPNSFLVAAGKCDSSKCQES
jgi:hypothetical protein